MKNYERNVVNRDSHRTQSPTEEPHAHFSDSFDWSLCNVAHSQRLQQNASGILEILFR